MPRLEAGALLDLLVASSRAHTAETHVTERVGIPCDCDVSEPSFGVAPSATTTIENSPPPWWRCSDEAPHHVDVERLLGHEDKVARHPPSRHRSRSIPRGAPSPPRSSPDRGSRRWCRDGRSRRRGHLHHGVEPEREVGSREIVVDGLRHAHHVPAPAVRELDRHTERVVAADRHERVDTVTASVARHFRAVTAVTGTDSSATYRGWCHHVRGSPPRSTAPRSSIDSPVMTPRQPCR